MPKTQPKASPEQTVGSDRTLGKDAASGRPAEQENGSKEHSRLTGESNHVQLEDGSRVAVIGGGPAGSFFSYFLLTMADRIGMRLELDIYESRDFSALGPAGCNMCGGIISESLVQTLAIEGIAIPPSVVQRGIDSYLLHMDVGSVRIETPDQEKRIGAVYRGAGPRGTTERKWQSFDGFLLDLAQEKGARLVGSRVTEVRWENGRPWVKTKDGLSAACDLLAVSAGVNSPLLKQLQELGIGYRLPETTKTYICEYGLGEQTIGDTLGSSMHTFLLHLPRLEFAAIIPKGDFATLCMLGEEIDKELVQAFLSRPEVKDRFPSGWNLQDPSCRCSPAMNVGAADRPFADRIVFFGDSGVSRLYKDGIGAAYRTSKAAAQTAVLEGISSAAFEKHYWPVCRKTHRDNSIGKLIFRFVGVIQRVKPARRAVLRMVEREQRRAKSARRMSTVLWDMFTGSAPYGDIFVRTLHPFFILGLVWNLMISVWPAKKISSRRRVDGNRRIGKGILRRRSHHPPG